jgi:hypothetical protein
LRDTFTADSKKKKSAQTYWETGMRSEGLELNLWKKTSKKFEI